MTHLSFDKTLIGHELHALATQMFPICRSMTGDGVRQTLDIIRQYIPIVAHEVPSGTAVFDWEVPSEWTVRDAYIKDQSGRRVVDFQQHNLHLVSGSRPVRQIMSWQALRQKLYTVPDHPDRIPFRTCHFKDDWGFCLTQNSYDAMARAGEQDYEVVIDSCLTNGSLTYGELRLPGDSTDEILFSAHICHPSLANDNLSGLSVATLLAKHLSALPERRYSYRFVFAPATIGAITWLAQNQHELSRIKHGLVLSLLGDPGPSTYKRSRSETAMIDQVVEHVLKSTGEPYQIRAFTPYGYDERQYCSPGIDLPMGCLMRTPDGEFDEYHTSADNLQFITPAALADSFDKCLSIVEILENDRRYKNLKPFGEPRLGTHGLYQSLPEATGRRHLQQAVQWVLNQSDGQHSLLDISMRSTIDFSTLADAARRLTKAGLIRPID